jgi:hypothetical protein
VKQCQRTLERRAQLDDIVERVFGFTTLAPPVPGALFEDPHFARFDLEPARHRNGFPADRQHEISDCPFPELQRQLDDTVDRAPVLRLERRLA